MKRLAAIVLLISWPWFASAFVVGETVFVPKGVWACYHPEYFVDSKNVLDQTQSLREAIRVLDEAEDCTRLQTSAPYTVKDVVGFYVSGDAFHGSARFYLLKLNFNGGRDIYIAARNNSIGT